MTCFRHENVYVRAYQRNGGSLTLRCIRECIIRIRFIQRKLRSSEWISEIINYVPYNFLAKQKQHGMA